MVPYISNFITQGKNEALYKFSEKTYFTPWWKFWDKKVKTEVSYYHDWAREFDREGHIIGVMHKRSVLHPRGVGSKHYWERLDTKTNIITAEPFPGQQVTMFPDGKCRETVNNEDGTQNVYWGYINSGGENVRYVRVTFKDGKQISARWLKNNKSGTTLSDILKENPVDLDEKAKKLEAFVTAYREGKEIPTDETGLRTFKDDEEKEKSKFLREESRKILTTARVRRMHGRR